MRLIGLVVGVCLLFCGSRAAAAPPVDSFWSDGRWAGSLANIANPIPKMAPGIDRAEQVHAGTSGSYKAVVILIQFTDNPADTIDHTPSAFADLLFSTGTHPTGSFRDYYREVSRGQFDIDGIVTRWYTAPHPYSYYANGQFGFGIFPTNAQGLAADAVLLADADVDFSMFDSDGPDGIPRGAGSTDDDGFVDGVFVVHAGPGGEEMGSVNTIWSLKWNLPAGFPVDGVAVYAFTTEPERWGLDSPGTNTTAGDLISVGVYCHEFGHILGVPDLYDRTDSPTATEGVGEWDLMGSGAYTHLAGKPLGSSPAHMSAWSKARLGWVTPTWVLQDSAGVTIPPVETSGQVFRLWTNAEEAGEYFLVENRQPVGFDAGLVRSSIEAGDGPARGLIIYHVDEGIFGNDNAAHKMLDVEEAGGAEIGLGFPGVQNLDVHRGSLVAQSVCGLNPAVGGNRGDRYDPWPGLQNAAFFEPGSCPSSGSYCVGKPSQVAVRNISETASDISADFFVNGITLQRLAVALDDTPTSGTPNNGNGRAEPGEVVHLRFPIMNRGTNPTGPITARLWPEPFITVQPDSALYPSIAGGQTDSGTVVEATIHQTADPRGVNISLAFYSAPGLVDSDSVQVLVGTSTGICDNFEGTVRRWTSTSDGCNGTNEWHREAGVNHTPGGAWAWRLGPIDLIGSYALSEDARLVSQPIQLMGAGTDTLSFWQRYDSEFAVDGLTVELSMDGAETWTTLTPVGGYSNGDKWTGTQFTFTEAKVPLTGAVGVVQIGFRFRSAPPNSGLGWWIDDVIVTGDDDCTTTSIAVTRFDATSVSGRAAVRLAWGLADAAGTTVGIDRAGGMESRRRIATLPSDGRDGEYEDGTVAPGITYTYWLIASRTGEPDAIAGPAIASVPLMPGSGAPPRALAIGPIRPNPFSPAAAFLVSLDRDGPYVIRIYRADGSLVRTLADSHGREGTLPFTWNGTDDRGNPVGAGLYFIQLRSGTRMRVEKAVLLR